MTDEKSTNLLRLFKAVKPWSESRGAKRVMVHVKSGDQIAALGFKKAERLLEKSGSDLIGGAFLS